MYFIVSWISYVFYCFMISAVWDLHLGSISSWINDIQSKKRTKLLIYRPTWKIHCAICFVHKMKKFSLFGLTFGSKMSRDFKKKSHEAARLKARRFCVRGKSCLGESPPPPRAVIGWSRICLSELYPYNEDWTQVGKNGPLGRIFSLSACPWWGLSLNLYASECIPWKSKVATCKVPSPSCALELCVQCACSDGKRRPKFLEIVETYEVLKIKVNFMAIKVFQYRQHLSCFSSHTKTTFSAEKRLKFSDLIPLTCLKRIRAWPEK